ncbi:MAG: recombinase family protein, partial [Clostridia bacterium]|nr:recombinase family protein [Clostridia bacterium]
MVIKIPANIGRAAVDSEKPKTLRVAAYARVSTEFEDQQNSFAAQVMHYTNYIKKHDGWEFVRVYADEGKSGRQVKYREGFQEMLKDGLDGKFDFLITKSVSRFARNTVDSLNAIRQLKEAGVEVYFEKENIRTFDSRGELMLSLMSSLAQEESRSISQNVQWGKHKLYSKGKFKWNWDLMYGFHSDDNITPIIVENEATVVREMFDLYLRGFTESEIAKILTGREVYTHTGSKDWNACTIKAMLENEKYCGNLRLQKTYTEDFLTGTRKKNEGQLPQYFIENNHEPIVAKKVFYLVQAERQRRKEYHKKYRNMGLVFSTRIVCGCCGSWYRVELRHKKGELTGYTFRCPYINENGEPCPTPSTPERKLKSSFLEAFNIYISQRDRLKAKISSFINQKGMIESLNAQLDEFALKLSEIREQMDDYDVPDKGIDGYNELIAQYANIEKDYEALKEQLSKYNDQCRLYRNLRTELNKRTDKIKEFDA